MTESKSTTQDWRADSCPIPSDWGGGEPAGAQDENEGSRSSYQPDNPIMLR